MPKSDESSRVWKVAEAKAKLSEVLRLSETEGPQVIGARKSYVVVPKRVWEANGLGRKHPLHGLDTREKPQRDDNMPMGQWLIENMTRGTCLPLFDRHPDRSIPFIDDEEE